MDSEMLDDVIFIWIRIRERTWSGEKEPNRMIALGCGEMQQQMAKVLCMPTWPLLVAHTDFWLQWQFAHSFLFISSLSPSVWIDCVWGVNAKLLPLQLVANAIFGITEKNHFPVAWTPFFSTFVKFQLSLSGCNYCWQKWTHYKLPRCRAPAFKPRHDLRCAVSIWICSQKNFNKFFSVPFVYGCRSSTCSMLSVSLLCADCLITLFVTLWMENIVQSFEQFTLLHKGKLKIQKILQWSKENCFSFVPEDFLICVCIASSVLKNGRRRERESQTKSSDTARIEKRDHNGLCALAHKKLYINAIACCCTRFSRCSGTVCPLYAVEYIH